MENVKVTSLSLFPPLACMPLESLVHYELTTIEYLNASRLHSCSWID